MSITQPILEVPVGGLPYPWIAPSSVKKDGKYRVTQDAQIRVYYTIDRREQALLTTDRHPGLVAKVQAVKQAHGDQESGVFYLNEWRHILVKAGGGTWFAGTYDALLEFDLDGYFISGRAPSGLTPGQPWPGPRVGIKYILTAGGDDIYGIRSPNPGREVKEYLSDYLAEASEIARKCSRHKPGGGGILINEARELFAPVERDGTIWLYLGYVGLDQWFPTPDPWV